MQLGSTAPKFKISRYLTRKRSVCRKLTKLPFNGPSWDAPHMMRHELPVVWCRDSGISLRMSDPAEPILDRRVFFGQTT
jgi:hypothetical protein